MDIESDGVVQLNNLEIKTSKCVNYFFEGLLC